MNDLETINRKLDLILVALGLDKTPGLSPAQMEEKVKNDVLRFQKKRNIKNDYVDPKCQNRSI
jgi:hypothetical protein